MNSIDLRDCFVRVPQDHDSPKPLSDKKKEKEKVCSPLVMTTASTRVHMPLGCSNPIPPMHDVQCFSNSMDDCTVAISSSYP